MKLWLGVELSPKGFATSQLECSANTAMPNNYCHGLPHHLNNSHALKRKKKLFNWSSTFEYSDKKKNHFTSAASKNSVPQKRREMHTLTQTPEGLSITSVAKIEKQLSKTQSWFHFYRQPGICYSKCSRSSKRLKSAEASFVVSDF